ncbi:MAG: Rrf2 family transcriptional regulator [Chloroflexota bacterium]|nr:Rrf2 family transcriptional regulator [Chloroflexota bacterium]
MKLSTRTRYATRALLDLALHSKEEPVLLRDIAQRQQISLPYLEQLVAPLKAGGLIRSIRGTKGGILLAKHTEEIKLSDVINLLEGPLALVDCINDANLCDRSEFCATRDIWGELQTAIDGVLEATTLHDLAERQKQKKQPEKSMYYI